jgi:hypothetical protein
MTQAVEHLPNKCKALSSNFSPAKNKQTKTPQYFPLNIRTTEQALKLNALGCYVKVSCCGKTSGMTDTINQR